MYKCKKRYEFTCPKCGMKCYVRNTTKIMRYCECSICKITYVINKTTNMTIKKIEQTY